MTAPGPRVLYIDDDDALRRLVSKALERRGFSVACAGSGAEGVAEGDVMRAVFLHLKRQN